MLLVALAVRAWRAAVARSRRDPGILVRAQQYKDQAQRLQLADAADGQTARLAALAPVLRRGLDGLDEVTPASTGDLTDDLVDVEALLAEAATRVERAREAAPVLRAAGLEVPRRHRRRLEAAAGAVTDAHAVLDPLERLTNRLVDRRALLAGGREQVLARLAELEPLVEQVNEIVAQEDLVVASSPGLVRWQQEWRNLGLPPGPAVDPEQIARIRSLAADPRASYADLLSLLRQLEREVDQVSRSIEPARQRARAAQERRIAQEQAARARAERAAARAVDDVAVRAAEEHRRPHPA